MGAPISSSPLDILKEYWGYDCFRPMQEEIICSVLAGKDTLALMPTGGGKSITFQVPAMLLEGVCIVITPLVALMKDQVDMLRSRKIKATYLHSGLSRRDSLAVLDNCLYGDYKFLYVSPERLENELFLKRLSTLNISFIVVDESHCVCQWGYDFRPAYLKISTFRDLLPDKTVLAVTATATPDVVDDIMKQLAFREGYCLFKRSFHRKNLSYVVRNTYDKLGEIVHILSSVEGSALIYVRSRKRTKEMAAFLVSSGFSADYYHAGLSPENKTRKQNEWQEGHIRIMVCTNAFGMGIDKDNVRLVIHPEVPPSPENYYQEAGRAGRDNQRAYGVLLYDPRNDRQILYRRLSKSFPPKEDVQRVYEAMGNFFQIALGYGEGAMFEFPLFPFCQMFHLDRSKVQASLQLLTLAGYIKYEEDKTLSSRLLITVSPNEIGSMFGEGQEVYDDILEVLLRHYTGLFTEHAFIDEKRICALLNISQEILYMALLNLDKWHIIDYIPGKRSSFVTYTQIRLPKEHIHLPPAIYEQRYAGEKYRLDSMIAYVTAIEDCRVSVLMRYFGESSPYPCGLCDRCLSLKSSGLTYKRIDDLSEELSILFKSRPSVPLSLLATKYRLSEKDVSKAMAFLGQEGFSYTVQGGLVIKET